MNNFERLSSTLKHVLKGQISLDMDDTLLQKLLSNLEDNLLHDKDSYIRGLIEKTQVLQDITEVIKDFKKDPMIASFSFQLLTLFLKDQEFDIFANRYESLLESILGVAQPISQNISASVTVSLLQCLTALISNKSGYLWISKNNLIVFGWKNLCGSSIFVHRTAESFLSRCFQIELDNCAQHNVITEMVYKTLNPDKMTNEYAAQRIVVGCFNFITAAIMPLANQKKTSPSFNGFLLETLKKYPLENETSDKISKLVVSTFQDDSFFISALESFLEDGRLITALKLSSNILTMLSNKDCSERHLCILICPLHLLTGGQGSGYNTVPPQLLSALVDACQDRNACRKILSTSVACLSTCSTHMHQQFKENVLGTSMKLIETITTRSMVPSTTASHLRDCRKILLSLLDLQMKLLNYSVEDIVSDSNYFLQVHVDLLQDVSLSPVVFQSSSRIVGLLGPLVWSERAELKALATLGACLKRRLLDRHWEVVDSVLELVTALLRNPKVHPNLYSWLLAHDLHVLLWDMLANREAEGYVRAACIEAVTSISIHDILWQRLQQDKSLTTETLGRLLCCLLRGDPEAFTQRASVNGLERLLGSGRLTLWSCPLVAETLLWAQTSCLDWQVKVTTLNIWSRHLRLSFLEKFDVPSIAAGFEPLDLEGMVGAITNLYGTGCLPALACALNDCDRPVRLLAAQISMDIRQKVKRSNFADLLLTNVDTGQYQIDGHGKTCILDSTVDVRIDRDQVMDSVLDTDMYDRIGAVIRPVAVDEEEDMGRVTIGFKCWEDVFSYLCKCNLDEIVEQNSKSTDVYDNNLCSLLEDILAAVDCKNKEDYQAIDCY